MAFNACWVAGDIEGAKRLLVSTDRLSEAALLSLTYGESKETVNNVVEEWKESLVSQGKGTIAERISLVGQNSGFPPTEEPLIDLSDQREKVVTEEEQKPIEIEKEEGTGENDAGEDEEEGEELHSASEEPEEPQE